MTGLPLRVARDRLRWAPGPHFLQFAHLIFVILLTTATGIPVFTNLPKTIDILENWSSPITNSDAIASNPNGPIKYSLVATPSGGPFSIDPVSGEISVPANSGFDYENISSYSLSVTADDGNNTSTGVLYVNIINVNEKPTFHNVPGMVHIPEDTIQSYIIYNLLSKDPENDKVTYVLISPLNVPFSVYPSGVITLQTNPGLDFETRREYRLLVQVQDHELNSTEILHIYIDDVNEPPELLNLGVTLTLPRDTVGPIFFAQAFDPDLNEDLKYTFISEPPSEFGKPFVLNPSTGQLAVNRPPGLDPSITNVYNVNITVMDKEGFSDWGILTVRIVDITDVPEIWNLPLTSVIKETATAGLKIFEARTIDMINGTRVYNITVVPDDKKFRYTYKLGQVWYDDNPHFDYEKISSYDITVTVSNGKKTSRPKKIHVIIKDMNEQPTLEKPWIDIKLKEDLTNAANIYKARGSDQDAGSTLTYNMTVSPPLGNSKFYIDPISGQISTVANPGFDYEAINMYALTVTVFDGEKLSEPIKLTVRILDINEPPEISTPSISISINEEEQIGFQLPWNCTANDNDRGEALTYDLEPTRDSAFFSLDTSNGQCALKVAKRIDSENMTSPDFFTLVVHVKDKQNHRAATTVMLTIVNVNEYDPEFLPDPNNFIVHVLENEDVDAPVISLHATDRDTGINGELMYNISTPLGRQFFDISLQGEVTLGEPLDRELVSVINFEVLAIDGGVPARTGTTSVTVVVLDDNDNRPVFRQAFYDFEVRYDSPLGTTVNTVTATDNDKPSKVLEYTILGMSHEFEVGSVTGVLQTRQTLLPNIRYLLYMQAQDLGQPHQETSEAVGVRIDTFVCEESLVRMDVYRQPSFFDHAGKEQFTTAMAGLFPGFVARVSTVSAGEVGGTSVVLVYILRNNSTGSSNAIYNLKEFVPVKEILEWTTFGDLGAPVVYLSSGRFSQFPVTKVTCECCVEEDINWWLDTTEGQATTGILSTIAVGLALAALSWLAMAGFTKCKQHWAARNVAPSTNRYARNPPLNTTKPQYGKGDEMKWWKLQPKSTFDENSPLSDKFRPPSQGSLTSQGSGIKTNDIRAQLTAAEQPPARSIPPALKPKPANAKGLWF